MSNNYKSIEGETSPSRKGNQLIDLRSDTVTRPGSGMREAMMTAPVGDDVYGEDESINALEATAAQLLGKEAAIFVASGTQSNLIAMLGHCARGEEIIVGDRYHVYIDEAGGASVLGGIAVCPLVTDDNGGLQVAQVEAAIKDDDIHSPISRLLCLENTVNGNVQSPDQTRMLIEAARARGLSAHLDGARLMNAAVALNLPAAVLAEPFDSVSLCLSKGLGAPVGTVLTGTRDFIHRARRNRKLLGGGMRQAGFLGAAGKYALEFNIDRMADDHDNAKLLADGLSAISQLQIRQQTNMVFMQPPHSEHEKLQLFLAENRIVISSGFPAIRLVTHLDISQADIQRVIDVICTYFKS